MSLDLLLASAPLIAGRDFAWDDWTVFDAYQEYETGREDEIETLCDAAKLALAIGLGEWLVAGLREYDTGREAQDQVAATWAAFSNTNFSVYWETDDDEWCGPYRGVLGMVITLLNDAVFCLHESPLVGMRTDWLLMYCQILFGDRDPFADWFERALAALRQVEGPRATNPDADPEDPRTVFRPPISRAYLGELGTYDPERERLRIEDFVRLDLRGNDLVEPD